MSGSQEPADRSQIASGLSEAAGDDAKRYQEKAVESAIAEAN